MNELRLFISINFSTEVTDGIFSAVTMLKENSISGNFSRRENLHLTLAFLGTTPPSRLPALRRAMAFPSQGFTLKTGSLGRFKRRSGDIWWLGVDGGAALFELQRTLSKNLMSAGFSLDSHNFRPHITLGREIIIKPGFDPVKISDSAPIPPQRVTKVSLMNSSREHGKLVYTELFSNKLI